MHILIIGSEGFIGRNAVKYFIQKGWRVSGCDLIDVKDPQYSYAKISRINPEFTNIFRDVAFSHCLNAAGNGSVPFSINSPFLDFEANTVDTYRILESLRNFQPGCRYINISSAAVYGNPPALPVKEDMPIKPLSPYGWHKYLSEVACTQFSTLYKSHTCSIRPFSVYGPGLQKQIFWDIYTKSHANRQIELFGVGNESRDFIYITDLIKAIDLVFEKAAMNGEVINIGSGVERTISEVASIFCRRLDKGLTLHFNGIEKTGDPKNWRADITILSRFGFSPTVEIQNGLTNVVKWLKERK